jgi:hypothetical protein
LEDARSPCRCESMALNQAGWAARLTPEAGTLRPSGRISQAPTARGSSPNLSRRRELSASNNSLVSGGAARLRARPRMCARCCGQPQSGIAMTRAFQTAITIRRAPLSPVPRRQTPSTRTEGGAPEVLGATTVWPDRRARGCGRNARAFAPGAGRVEDPLDKRFREVKPPRPGRHRRAPAVTAIRPPHGTRVRACSLLEES